MKNRVLLAFTAVFLSYVGIALPARSELPDYIQQEIERVGQLSSEANRFVDQVLYPMSVRQQNYERLLQAQCNQGVSNACTELTDIERRRVQWMIQNDCVYRTGLNSCSREQ